MSPCISSFPHRWQDDVVAVLCSGPTLCQEDVDKLQGKCKVIAVNDSYLLCPWADILWGADWDWWRHHEYVQGFEGERWTTHIGRPGWAQEAYSNGIKVIRGLQDTKDKNTKGARLPDDNETLPVGNNGAFQALNLAVMSGSKRIILLGVDMQHIDGKSHWFGNHPAKLKQTRNFGIFRECFRKVRRDLELRGIEVVNCSPRTTLNCFRKVKLDEVL